MNARLSKYVVSVVLIVTLALAIAPFAGAQEGGAPPTFVELVPYEGSPVLPRGPDGAWDSGHTFGGAVIAHDGLFHMFYTASSTPLYDVPSSVGYATSEDGLTWTKYEGNPVLTLTTEVAPNGVLLAVPVVDGNTWVLFMIPTPPKTEFTLPILRATAPDPTGPWTAETTPVLEGGTGLDWDGNGLALTAALRTADEFVIYYFASPSGIGRATSPDGVTWTKYDDPATSEDPFRTSDLVLGNGLPGTWDDGVVFSSQVYVTEHGWIMLYSGQPHDYSQFGIGFAWSPDGITWTRYGNAPLLSFSFPETYWVGPNSIVMKDENTFFVYQCEFSPATGYTEIGVWIATITW